jgi:uncharacterized protein YqgC (DUF456 family)
MTWIAYLIASLFTLLGAACVASIILSIPGTWIMLALALIIEVTDQWWRVPDELGRTQTFEWWLLGVCLALAAIGEAIEFAAGAAGAKQGGGSRRGMIGALIGGILGAIILTPFIPVPVVGTLIGAIVGTFTGAVLGEVTGPQPMSVKGSMKPALGATIGRVVGTVSKIGVAIVVWLTLSVAAFWP